MTVETQTNISTYIGNGSTVVFPFDFIVFEANDLVVTYYNALTNLPIRTVSQSEYTIAGLNSAEGGSITITSGAPTSGIQIERIVQYTQSLSLSNEAGFFPETLEQQLDYLEMQIQQVKSLIQAAPPVIGIVTGVAENIYVSDALATAALNAKFPNLCPSDGNGGYTRLAADKNGYIYLSQMGNVPISGLGNAQPFVQMMVDYGNAIACTKFKHNMKAVDLWCPPRTSATTSIWAEDGQPLNVRATAYFEGDVGGSSFNYKGPTGGPWATDFQVVAGNIWRGCMVMLLGGSNTIYPPIGEFATKNMIFNGGTSYILGTAYTGSTPSSPGGFDSTNKGIAAWATSVNSIWMEDTEISGVQGELYYFAPNFSPNNLPSVPQYLHRVKMHDSPQSCFNPSVGGWDVDDCEFGNSYGVYEILGGGGGRIHNCRFYDGVGCSVTGGPANGFYGGSYAYPTRDNTKTPPWVHITNCVWDNVKSVGVANFINLSGIITDGFIVMDGSGAPGSPGALMSTYIDATVVLDKFASGSALNAFGPPTLTTPITSYYPNDYIPPVDDVHVRLRVRRTSLGKSNGLHCVAFALSGFYNQETCSFALDEGDCVSGLVYVSGTLGSFPFVSLNCPTSSVTFGAGLPAAASLQGAVAGALPLYPVSPSMALYNSGAAGNIPVTIPASFATYGYGYADGQEILIMYAGGFTTTGTVFTFGQNDTGMRLNGNRRLYPGGDRLKLRYDAPDSVWVEVDYFSHTYFLNGSGVITPASLASGAMAVLGTLSLPNAVVGDLIDSVSASSATGGVNIWGEVTAAATVTLYARNDKGSAYSPGATTYTVTGHKA